VVLPQSNRPAQGANLWNHPRRSPGHEAMERGERCVHEWRVTQLIRLGIPGPLAEADADRIDFGPRDPAHRTGSRAGCGDARRLGRGRRRDHRAGCGHRPRCPGAECRGAGWRRSPAPSAHAAVGWIGPSSTARDTRQGFNVRQVRDRLDMAAGAGNSLAAPVPSRGKVIQVMPDGDLQNIRRGP